MASKSPPKTAAKSVAVERLSALRKIGLGSKVKNISKLTDSEKKRIASDWSKYKELAEHPTEWKKISVKDMGPKARATLTKANYKIVGDKAYIPLQKYDKASVTTKYVKNKKTGTYDVETEIKRVKGKKTEREKLYSDTEAKMDAMERLAAEYAKSGFKEGDFIGLKVFDNPMFVRRPALDMNTLYRYVPEIKWKDPDHQKMMDNLHIVVISTGDYRDLADTTTQKQKDRRKYQAQKQRRKTDVEARRKYQLKLERQKQLRDSRKK